MSQGQYEQTVAAEERYQAEQDALPPHKRDGWADQMKEQADMRRDELKGN